MLAARRKRAKGTPKASTVAIYASVFALLVAVIAVGYRAPQEASGVANTATATPINQAQQTSVDEVVAITIASSLAETTNLSVASNVAELSVSLATKNELTQSNESVISKPQILQTSDARTVTTYKAKSGDTVDELAAQYNVSKDTIRWANNLTSDALVEGKVLKILPISGVQYKVETGDTLAELARKYKSDEARIVLYNDLDQAGLKAGQTIILPDGQLPEAERPGYVAPVAITYGYGYGTTTDQGYGVGNNYGESAGNRYSFGYCTWYVYERRAELGRPIGSFWGNASSWAWSASSAGYKVDRTPRVGAIVQNGGGLGHVAIVESISANGDVVLSEMNYGGGWNIINRGRVISAGQASLYNYIH